MSTQWTWRHNDFIAEQDVSVDRQAAVVAARKVAAINPGHDVGVVRRTVSDWIDVEIQREQPRDAEFNDDPWPQCMYGELAQCWCRNCGGASVPGRTGLDEECEP